MTQPPEYEDVAYWDANNKPVRYDELPPPSPRRRSGNERLVDLLLQTVEDDHD